MDKNSIQFFSELMTCIGLSITIILTVIVIVSICEKIKKRNKDY